MRRLNSSQEWADEVDFDIANKQMHQRFRSSKFEGAKETRLMPKRSNLAGTNPRQGRCAATWPRPPRTGRN